MAVNNQLRDQYTLSESATSKKSYFPPAMKLTIEYLTPYSESAEKIVKTTLLHVHLSRIGRAAVWIKHKPSEA